MHLVETSIAGCFRWDCAKSLEATSAPHHFQFADASCVVCRSGIRGAKKGGGITSLVVPTLLLAPLPRFQHG